MCGIVGYIGDKSVVSVLLSGLHRLEYRGYDSAGIATIDNSEIDFRKTSGKISNLEAFIKRSPIEGEIGIGHTRWATHGVPNSENSHPLFDEDKKIMVVHNGIIENYSILKNTLQKEGVIFKSETDTEVIPHLIAKYYQYNHDIEEAFFKTLEELEGAYALAVLSEYEPKKIFFAREGSPLILGLGENESFIASDELALIPLTKTLVYLSNGDRGYITKDGIKLFNKANEEIRPTIKEVDLSVEKIEKNGYEHYMLKEIFEQPDVARKIVNALITEKFKIFFEHNTLPRDYLANLSKIIIQACGTSMHAGMIGKLYFEEFARINAEVDSSSEFRSRRPVIGGNTMVMAISQSGETADTLAGIHEAKSKFLKVFSILNNKNSSIARVSDSIIDIMAGPEIGVASTKAYTAEIMSLLILAIFLGRLKWTIKVEERIEVLQEAKTIPQKMEMILNTQIETIKKIAKKYSQVRHFMFLGRSYNYPSALEGALKLKEISYIHATGYPAGEFKHGPIALVDDKVPVLCIAVKGEVYTKMLSNIQEVRARKGRIIAIATEGDKNILEYAEDVIYVPETLEELSPLLTVLPMQLLAYYIAVERGCDVDQPRNLAKSVTVE